MKKRNKILSIIVPFLILACSDEENQDPDPAAEYTVQTDAFTFYADVEKFGEAEARRATDDYCSVPFGIKKVQREGDRLTVTLSRPVDCEITYDIFWDGLVLESFPVQISLFVKGNADTCEDSGEYRNDELDIDLKAVFEEAPQVDIDGAVFTVKDACSLVDVQCENDCDVSVSNN